MPDTSDYTANFAMDNSNYMSWYTPEGDWIGSMTTVDTVNVPAPVITSVHTQYVGYDLGTVTKFKNKNKTQYIIKINKGGEKMKLLVDENGQIIKKK